MGAFAVTIDVAGPDRARFVPVEALVDTGSTFTVLPTALLQDLGVEVEHRSWFTLADGRQVERDLGRAWVRLRGEERYTLVVFGDHALLGAVTLEEFLLAPDLVARQLVPVPGLMMRLAA